MANGKAAGRKKEIRDGIESALTRMDETLAENERLISERDDALRAHDNMKAERDGAIAEADTLRQSLRDAQTQLSVAAGEKATIERLLMFEREERAFYHAYAIDVTGGLNAIMEQCGRLLERAKHTAEEAEQRTHADPVSEFSKRNSGGGLPMIETPRFLEKPRLPATGDEHE
jgi:hypothetical protein